ncbi:hypothetical protein TNCV_4454591 [Trichonephila clavipes]|nr:hypothetical protein TNCV_4454591 [Trichonephila clavipes]
MILVNWAMGVKGCISWMKRPELYCFRRLGVAWLVCRSPSSPKVACSNPAQVGGFSRSRKSTAAMSYDNTACKRSQERMFSLGDLDKIKIPKYKFRVGRAQVPPSGVETGSENYLRRLLSPKWGCTQKRYQLPGIY